MTRPANLFKAGLLGLVILLCGSTAAWLWPRRPLSIPPVSNVQFLVAKPVAVAPGVYLLGQMSPAAAYLVQTSEGLVLIDSGMEANASDVTDQIAMLGLDSTQIRAILLTHVHVDHSLGAQHLRSLTNAKVYAGRADCEPLRRGEPREAFLSTFYLPQVKTHATTVDEELVGAEIIEFGETRFRAIAAPGHTPGSVCYLLERPDLRALFAGDVIQHLSTDTEGALGTYAAFLPPLYRGNAADYLATLRRLRALPVPDLVLPGHPRSDPSPQNPRLSEERWHVLLDQGIAEMEKLCARYEADGANFLDAIPKELLPGLHYLGMFGGSAVYCLATANNVFVFDAPGGPLFETFLSNRFHKLGWDERKLTAALLTSADEEATSGLFGLVERTGCIVVASKAASEVVRSRCPPQTTLLVAEDVEKNGWLDARVIALEGRGLAPTAYEIHWSGKTLLFSGQIPVKVTALTVERLRADVMDSHGGIKAYLKSLARLADVNPKLWLPAVPVNGQNANLYDDDWAQIVAKNKRLFQ
jgi:glyoxylase-like metal-dependent hydrolase (beta-lactamase superfamily II)